MITLQDPEYRRLARDSSNLMLRYDGEWAQENYEESGRAIWSAGVLRLQMAQMSRKNGDLARAAGDCLSAAACFIRAGDSKLTELALEWLSGAGPLPADRQDLTDEFDSRTKQARELRERQQQFLRTIERHPEWRQNPDEAALLYAHEHLPEFPAWGKLHSFLAHLATEGGEFKDAAHHALLAAEFDPEQPFLVCIAMIALAKVDPAEKVMAWGLEQASRFPNDPNIRIVLAYVRALYAHDENAYHEVVALLLTLPRNHEIPLWQRILVLALCAYVTQELKLPEVHVKCLRGLGQLRQQLSESALPPTVVTELEGMVDACLGNEPQASPNTNGACTPAATLREVERLFTWANLAA